MTTLLLLVFMQSTKWDVPPKIIHQVNPTYTPQGRDAHVQGTVVFQAIIDVNGKPTDLLVLNPLGFGLDEAAQAAIATWRFKPGTKNGQPVPVYAEIATTFKMPGIYYDDRAENDRVAFNIIVSLHKTGTPLAEKDLETLRTLSNHKFLPAMLLVGRMTIAGEQFPKDPEAGLKLIETAANKHHGPAEYYLGKFYLTGTFVPKDVEKGMHLIQDASLLGSPEAQFFLGERYETGDGVERDFDRARRSFKLCAARGSVDCQVRLARLLRVSENHDRDYPAAMAWFELAASKGNAEAKAVIAEETPKWTSEEQQRITKLNNQLRQPGS